jgi:hypothetical protein
MSFGFGELTDLACEGERLPEVPEAVSAPDQAGAVEQLPIPDEVQIALGLFARQGRDAAMAGVQTFSTSVSAIVCPPRCPTVMVSELGRGLRSPSLRRERGRPVA